MSEQGLARQEIFQLVICAPVTKKGVVCDFIGLYFIDCSYIHIENDLKTFQSIDYTLIYAQQIVIICFQHALEHTSTPSLRYWPELTASDLNKHTKL